MTQLAPDISDERIGFLHEGAFLCIACTDKLYDKGRVSGRIVPVFLANIRPYSQVCHECGKLVVDGAKKSTDGTPLCVFDPPILQPNPHKLTPDEIARQDHVDNAIYNLVNELVPAEYASAGEPNLAWDMDWIASIRNEIEQVMVEYLEIPSDEADELIMAFYPHPYYESKADPETEKDDPALPTKRDPSDDEVDDPWEDKR